MASLPAFLRAWLRPGARHRVDVIETSYPRAQLRVPATLYRPRRRGRVPGWVVLHGLTFSGREHRSLIRFANAIAAAGNAVLVPDIPEWRELKMATAVTRETIRAAVRELHDRDDVDADRVGLFGFSFGATQALIAASDAHVQSLLRGIVAWGGYCDLERLSIFGMTGDHELDGNAYHTRPDPYGAWIMAGNYLTRMRGHEDDGAVAAALHTLAMEAGRVRAFAWEPVYDPLKHELRAALPADKRELFDVIAPLTDAPPGDIERRRSLGLLLAETILRVDPGMDPAPHLPSVGVDVVLAHGRDDRLIPFTESIRLSRALPRRRRLSCTVTALFEHSGGTNLSLGPSRLVREVFTFVHVLHRILHLL